LFGASLNPGRWSSTGGYINNVGIYLTTCIENAIGGRGNDIIIGNEGNNNLIGGLGNDRLNADIGSDMISGGPGDDLVEGGSGFDIASFEGPRSGYLVSGNAANARASGAGGVDTLTNVEVLIFSDGLVNFVGQLPNLAVYQAITIYNADPSVASPRCRGRRI
jgi:Ca2+-binding RTX toxin-like protein